MNPRIQQTVAHDDHTMTLVFANGEVRIFDMHPYLGYPAFVPLRNIALFKRAHADHGTVAWPGGIDFDPDTLYLEGRPVPAQQIS